MDNLQNNFNKTYASDLVEAQAFGYFVESLKFITDWNKALANEDPALKNCLKLNT